MTDILTITLNPALDISSTVETVQPGHKLRCEVPVYDPGGGGINVARAVHFLGGEATAFVAVAGYRGAHICNLLQAEGVPLVAFQVAGESRESLAVIDRTNSRQYRFVMPGPAWNETMAEAAMQAIADKLHKGSFLVLSGSQPEGVPDGFPAHLATLAKSRKCRLIVDTSGPALSRLLSHPAAVEVLRLDRAESEKLAGRRLTSIANMASFAAALVAQGVAQMVVLAIGSKGSVLASAAGCWHAVTPKVPVVSKVGAGDSFVGAFSLALSRGQPPSEALSHGVAAASAAVMSDATALCRKADFRQLYGQVSLNRL